jgi:hypothetical protein
MLQTLNLPNDPTNTHSSALVLIRITILPPEKFTIKNLPENWPVIHEFFFLLKIMLFNLEIKIDYEKNDALFSITELFSLSNGSDFL